MKKTALYEGVTGMRDLLSLFEEYNDLDDEELQGEVEHYAKLAAKHMYFKYYKELNHRPRLHKDHFEALRDSFAEDIVAELDLDYAEWKYKIEKMIGKQFQLLIQRQGII